MVPNPYTLMGQIPYEHEWFTVTYFKDAFWACPLDPESQDIFAFEWEDPETGREQQYFVVCCTGLPQGFTESPSLFG